MEVNPLSIILVKSDSKGDRLLFRYPFKINEDKETLNETLKKNPYTLHLAEENQNTIQNPTVCSTNISRGILSSLSDEVLSSLFAVKSNLCDKKFELKINDVRFISHPTLLQLKTKQDDSTGIMLINVVFALSALASPSVVNCYHDLSQRLGIILRHEEKRCAFVTEQTQCMMSAHDECTTNIDSIAAFQVILEKSLLAMNLKTMYDDLYQSGVVNIRVNRWISLSFCLPQKAHQWHLRGKIIEPEDIDRCLQALRPYHSLLLLHPVEHLIAFNSLDGSSTLIKLLTQYSPMKNLQTLAADADLTLSHVFELTAHLVYWAKATVIFPVCATNRYVISPNAPLHYNSMLLEKFSNSFPGLNLIKVISEFSEPSSLMAKLDPALSKPNLQTSLVQNIIWMLQHHLLLQLHTYIEYMPSHNGVPFKKTKKKKFDKTIPASPKTSSSVLSGSFPEPTAVRTESESGASTISEILNPFNMDTISFTTSFEEYKHQQDYQEELLLDFPDEERREIFKIPAANTPEDLRLFAKLRRKGYFEGNHHIEEIMYLENLRRSQLIQLLDKFLRVLVTYDTEDPAIAMFSCNS